MKKQFKIGSAKKGSLLPPTAPITKRSNSPKNSVTPNGGSKSANKKSLLFNKSTNPQPVSLSQSRKESLLCGTNYIYME
jgi:hypothetical protein